MQHGTKVRCSAEGNPHPNFYWIHLDGNRSDSYDGYELNLCNIRRSERRSNKINVLHGDDSLTLECVAVRDKRNDSKQVTISDAAVQALCDQGKMLILH